MGAGPGNASRMQLGRGPSCIPSFPRPELMSTILKRPVGRVGMPAQREDALAAREVDSLISKLLDEIKVPYSSLSKAALAQLADLRKVLAADYIESSLPPKPMLKELARIVETEIKSHAALWENLDGTSGMLGHFSRIFGPRELAVRAEPYREGAGLALRGFFCRTRLDEQDKFVIFVNTAHHPGAVAATLGHELGHYIYGSMAGEKAPMTALMEGSFASHLASEDELFADSLVALSAYSHETIRNIGLLTRVRPGSSEELFERIKGAYDLIAQRFSLDLSRAKMAAAWRVRYLTSMTHFFKLRCALYQSAGL